MRTVASALAYHSSVLALAFACVLPFALCWLVIILFG
jgi:hypothetical protein